MTHRETRGGGVRKWERYRRRARLADSLETVVWLTVAIVLALFLADGGLADFRTSAGIFTGIGIIAGLVGTDLILVQLILAARVPAIDRAFGHDRALGTHQRLGKPIFYLISAHVLFLWIGYGLAAHVNVIGEAVTMLFSLADMKTAYIGYALLALVVITSLVIVRRKYPYELWHAVHLLAYAAVLAALPHQFSDGQFFAAGTWARYYWGLLYVAAVAAVLVYRFIVPVSRSIRHNLRVGAVTAVAPGVYSIVMKGHRLAELQARGGQFFVWRFWAPGHWWHAHPFSLSAAPKAGSLRITVRELGHGTAGLGSLPAGTRVSIEGPYGLFTDRARTTRRAVAVAAGIGITPIISLLANGDFADGDMTVIVRAGNENNLYLYDELRRLCVKRSATLYVLLGHRGDYDSWLPEANRGASLATIVPDVATSDVYICGPRNWADLVVDDAKRCGVPGFRIHYERFSW